MESHDTDHDDADDLAVSTGESPTPLGWLDTTDHKRIGRLFIVTSLLMGVGAWVLSFIVALDLTDASGSVVLDRDTFAQTFVLSRDALVFLFVIPFFLGLAMYVVPLQVGSGNLAFPRLATASFWTWFLAGDILVASYLVNGGPYGGEREGVDLYLAALGGVVLALLAGAVVVATTVLSMRSPRLFLDATPPFSWASMVTAVMLLVTLPVLFGQVILLYVDHRYGTRFLGGNFGIHAQIEWVYRNPMVFIYAVPALGAIAEIVPAAARGRIFQPAVAAFAIAFAGIFGFGAYTLFAYEDQLADSFQGLVLVLLHGGQILAILALLGVLGATVAMSKQRPTLSAPFFAAGLGGLLLLIGATHGFLGVVIDWADIPERDLALRDTTYTTAQLILTVGGAALVGYGALHWWAPKIWGRSLNQGLGLLTVLAGFVGAFVGALGAALAGQFEDQPDFVFADPIDTTRYADVSGIGSTGNIETFQVISVIGLALAVAAIALVALNLAMSVLLRRSADADVPADPWEAQSPEWAVASPPALGPVDELPDLASGTPLLDEREADGDATDDAGAELEEVGA